MVGWFKVGYKVRWTVVLMEHAEKIRRDCIASKGEYAEKGGQKESPEALLRWWVENLLVEEGHSEELAGERYDLVVENVFERIGV